MHRFSSGGLGRSEDKWFTVGSVDVTTTTLITGVSLLWMFVYALEGGSKTVSSLLAFDSASVLRGQIWRVVTWPIVNSPGLFTVLAIVIFFMLGSQIEVALGRRRQAMFLAYLTIIPALFLTLGDLVSNIAGVAAGIDLLEMGVFVAFVMFQPAARFFFGIPGWVLAVVFIGIGLLSALSNRNTYLFLFILVVVATSLLLTRAFGLAEYAKQVPKIDLPVALGGDPHAQSARTRRKAELLKVVRDQEEMQDEIDQIEIDSILDQVSDGGMESLSRTQKKKLEQYAKQQRKKKGL